MTALECPRCAGVVTCSRCNIVRTTSEEPVFDLTHNGKYRLPHTGEEVEALIGNPKWAHLLPGMANADEPELAPDLRDLYDERAQEYEMEQWEEYWKNLSPEEKKSEWRAMAEYAEEADY